MRYGVGGGIPTNTPEGGCELPLRCGLDPGQPDRADASAAGLSTSGGEAPGSHDGIDEGAVALLGQYRRIFEALSDGLIINDPERGVVVEVNFAFWRMHGYTREELVGALPSMFVHSDSHHLGG